MIKTRLKNYAAFCLLMAISLTIKAQQYEWVKGGGSTRSFSISADWEKVIALCTDDNRNVYGLADVGDAGIQADTFFRNQAVNFSGSNPKSIYCSLATIAMVPCGFVV